MENFVTILSFVCLLVTVVVIATVSLTLIVNYFTTFVVLVVENDNFANSDLYSTTVHQSFSKQVRITKDNTPSMPLTEAHLEGFFILSLPHA